MTEAEFQFYPDQEISEAELVRARVMLRSGEIDNDTFGWLVGILDEREEIPFHKMTQAQKRRYFAQRRQADLFGSTGVRKRRSSRKAKSKALIKPEFWSGNQVEIAK